MKKRRHTPEQITRKLRAADRLLAEGKTIPEVANDLNISERRARRITGQAHSTQSRLPIMLGVMTCTAPTVMWRIPAIVATHGRLRG